MPLELTSFITCINWVWQTQTVKHSKLYYLNCIIFYSFSFFLVKDENTRIQRTQGERCRSPKSDGYNSQCNSQDMGI